MRPLRRKWGVFLCRCSLPPAFDEAGVQFEGAVVAVDQAPAGLKEFAALLRQSFADQVLWSCRCSGIEPLEQAMDAVGIAPETHELDLQGLATAVHEVGSAAEKVVRLVRGQLATLDARPALVQNLLTVGQRVALFTDRPAGLDLARKLAGETSVMVFAEGDAETFGQDGRRVNWGHLERVSGHLGGFQATVTPVTGSDFAASQQVQADQVVLLGSAGAALRARTGVHRLVEPDADGIQSTAAAVTELTGTFAKPELVRYDSAICAGGAAGQQACGRCIPACPYDAIARSPDDPLRVRVDQLTCEGCGACASACPTSALSFTEPAPEALYAKLEAMLAPANGNNGEPAAIMFHCEQQGRAQLAWAAEQQSQYSARVLPVEVPCLRYVSESAMLAALRFGAAGVGLLGCEDCPNGERTLLLGKIDLAQRILDAFGLGRERLRLLTVDDAHRGEGMEALAAFAGSLGAAPVGAEQPRLHAGANRAVLGDAIGTLISATGKEPGGIKVRPEDPFAFAEVNDKGCTLCRACATVCPTHAFAFDEDEHALRFKHIECVNCGLCTSSCPERVITLRSELYLERSALDYVTVAQDEMVHCARCQKPYINRRALEIIQSKLRAATEIGDTFGGGRSGLLTMCPDCRAGAAMLEMDQGWKP